MATANRRYFLNVCPSVCQAKKLCGTGSLRKSMANTSRQKILKREWRHKNKKPEEKQKKGKKRINERSDAFCVFLVISSPVCFFMGFDSYAYNNGTSEWSYEFSAYNSNRARPTHSRTRNHLIDRSLICFIFLLFLSALPILSLEHLWFFMKFRTLFHFLWPLFFLSRYSRQTGQHQ